MANESTNEIMESAEEEAQTYRAELHPDHVLSTGSTLLDLSISGGRLRGGGIPGGRLIEIYGPSQSGKTAVLVELCASAQFKGGNVEYFDPEARLDLEYSRIFGMELDKKNYYRPNTVSELFRHIYENDVADKNVINVIAADSLAALSTELEMEKGDKMGMKRAKEFSEGLRKTARVISQDNRLIICSNQIRQGDYGETTPGGKGIPFYADIRIRIQKRDEVELKKKLKGGKEVSKVIGIMSMCKIIKSIDDPFRECPIYIIFGHGIDDIRGNLQYYKDMTKSTKYLAVDKEYQSMNAAINWIEQNNLEDELREMVIDLWEEIESMFQIQRKGKVRF